MGLDVIVPWVRDMEASEIGAALRQPQAGRTVGACLEAFPALTLDAQLQPITRYFLSLADGIGAVEIHYQSPCKPGKTPLIMGMSNKHQGSL